MVMVLANTPERQKEVATFSGSPTSEQKFGQQATKLAEVLGSVDTI